MGSISWTDMTWNPIAGCSLASPGCTNCYAMRMAGRLERMGTAKYVGLTQRTKAGDVWTGKLAFDEAALTIPLRCKKPRKVFVNSMSDLFHEDVPDEWIDRVLAVMALCPQHTFQVLTKRAGRMRAYLTAAWERRERLGEIMMEIGGGDRAGWFAPECDGKRGWVGISLPLPNVWLGASVEDQPRADERVPELLRTPAAVRFLSGEPLLGPVDLERHLRPRVVRACEELTDKMVDAGWSHPGGQGDHAGIDWVIVGGESGPRARRCDVAWIESLVAQCQAAGTAIWVKQLGARAVYNHISRPLRDRAGANPAEWPEHLRVQQFPAPAEAA